jgi:hypothetical protein
VFVLQSLLANLVHFDGDADMKFLTMTADEIRPMVVGPGSIAIG